MLETLPVAEVVVFTRTDQRLHVQRRFFLLGGLLLFLQLNTRLGFVQLNALFVLLLYFRLKPSYGTRY